MAEQRFAGMTCAEAAELAPAFVLGALGAAESDAVRRHLADCPELHAEMADIKGPGPKVDATSSTWLGLLGGTLKPWLAFTRGMVVCRAGLLELRWLQQVAERLQKAYAE